MNAWSHDCFTRSLILLLFLAAVVAGCGRQPAGDDRVTVYSALDREFSEPLLRDFERRTGIRVLPKFDVESTKTVGLANLIIEEAAAPRCDLFWNNEVLNTLRLKEKGLLARFRPGAAAAIPPAFKAKDGTWYGFAARARVLLVNTRLVAEADWPSRLEDLTDPRWKGRIGLAKPLFGTTATHAACLFAVWGEAKARGFFEALKANGAQILAGNKDVARAVGAGQIAVGLTDTDDAVGELAAGSPVAIVYPDRRPDQLGTLFLPNTLAVIKGAPHPRAAEALADDLLGPEVEAALARGPGAQIPLNPRVTATPQVETPRTVHAMDVDFEAAAKLWDRVAVFLASAFAG
jgi:iron(III) transport system substrate-binding protein